MEATLEAQGPAGEPTGPVAVEDRGLGAQTPSLSEEDGAAWRAGSRRRLSQLILITKG